MLFRSTILKSDVAIRRCVQIIRAFTALEQTSPNWSEKLEELASTGPLFIKAIVNELGEIHNEVINAREEIKDIRKHLEDRMKRIEAGMVGLSSNRHLPAPPSDPETWIDPRQAAMLRNLAKEKGRTRQRIAGIWKEFKLHFGVDRYVHLPAARFLEAMEWMRSR